MPATCGALWTIGFVLQVSGTTGSNMGPLLRIACLFVIFAFHAWGMRAQDVVPAGDVPNAVRIFDNASANNSLPCDLQFRASPWLDFLFRYTEGFEINCRIGELVLPGT